MTLQQIYEILQQTGLPIAYRFFKTRQEPPFICYLVAYTNNQGADNIVWANINHIQIELYTKEKDPQTEQTVEQVLAESGLFFNAEETYIDSEKLYQKIYEIEV